MITKPADVETHMGIDSELTLTATGSPHTWNATVDTAGLELGISNTGLLTYKGVKHGVYTVAVEAQSLSEGTESMTFKVEIKRTGFELRPGAEEFELVFTLDKGATVDAKFVSGTTYWMETFEEFLYIETHNEEENDLELKFEE